MTTFTAPGLACGFVGVFVAQIWQDYGPAIAAAAALLGIALLAAVAMRRRISAALRHLFT